HPYFNNKELVEENKKRGIVSEAWSPLGRKINDVLENDTIHSIAKKYNRSPAQIIGRWNIQNDVLHVVNASTPKNQQENVKIIKRLKRYIIEVHRRLLVVEKFKTMYYML